MTAISELTGRQTKFFQDCDRARPGEITQWNDHRGTGKTWALLEEGRTLCAHGDTATRGLIVYGYPYFIDSAELHYGPLGESVYRSSQRKFTYPNGSTIYMMDRFHFPERAQGLQLDWIAFDLGRESEMTDKEISIARHLVRHSGCGKIIVVGQA